MQQWFESGFRVRYRMITDDSDDYLENAAQHSMIDITFTFPQKSNELRKE